LPSATRITCSASANYSSMKEFKYCWRRGRIPSRSQRGRERSRSCARVRAICCGEWEFDHEARSSLRETLRDFGPTFSDRGDLSPWAKQASAANSLGHVKGHVRIWTMVERANL